MGTRHLTCVAKGDKMLYTKYGQWDGYPTGVGYNLAEFLVKEYDRTALEIGCLKLKPVGKNHHLENGCTQKNEGWISSDDEGWDEYFKKFPLLTRDTSGGDVLRIIQNSEGDEIACAEWSMDFGFDSLFCEWAYVVDIETNTLEVYQGFQEKRHTTGRWAAIDPDRKENDDYYPIKLVATIPIGTPEEEMKALLKELEEQEA